MNAAELREMSDEQLGVELEQAAQGLFRLRVQSQTETLNAPSELRRQRRLIARIRTVQRERELSAVVPAGAAESSDAASDGN